MSKLEPSVEHTKCLALLLEEILDMRFSSQATKRSFVGVPRLRQHEKNILIYIHRHNSVTMSELSEVFVITQSTLTGIVDRLVEKNIVKRHRSEKDRRIVYLYLTTDGENIAIEERCATTKVSHLLLQSLLPVDQERLIALLESALSTAKNTR